MITGLHWHIFVDTIIIIKCTNILEHYNWIVNYLPYKPIILYDIQKI